MIYLESSSPSKGSNLPLYTQVGRVHGGLGGLVYGLCALESRRVLQWCGWTLALSWSWRSPGCRLVVLF